MMAKRSGKVADELQQDFDITNRRFIANCSKWLNAALAMYFADEGKLSLEDTLGKFLPVMSANNNGSLKLHSRLFRMSLLQLLT